MVWDDKKAPETVWSGRRGGPAIGAWKAASAAVGGMCGLLMLAACVSEPQTPGFYEDLASVNAEVNEDTAASMFSQYRLNNGLGVVVQDPELTRLAEIQAKAMADAGNVNASLNQGYRLKDLMAKIGETDVPASNNVSGGYYRLSEAFSGWRESPKHNAVMLDKNARRFGLATAYAPNAKHKVFWSLIMAAPKQATAPAPKP